MDDFSLYQWLVLGLLSIIALSAVALVFGLDRSLEAMTRRLESALGRKANEDSPTDDQESLGASMSIGAWIVSVILIFLAGRVVFDLSKISDSVRLSESLLREIEMNTRQAR